MTTKTNRRSKKAYAEMLAKANQLEISHGYTPDRKTYCRIGIANYFEGGELFHGTMAECLVFLQGYNQGGNYNAYDKVKLLRNRSRNFSYLGFQTLFRAVKDIVISTYYLNPGDSKTADNFDEIIQVLNVVQHTESYNDLWAVPVVTGYTEKPGVVESNQQERIRRTYEEGLSTSRVAVRALLALIEEYGHLYDTELEQLKKVVKQF